MNEILPAVEVETAPRPDFSVLWLHGLGADGNDFVPLVDELALPASAAVRFVFPHAPAIPVTCNNGYVMRAWYDLAYLPGGERQVDAAGIDASCAALRRLIARENERGVPTRRIVLAGFSQGGAIAYLAGLTHAEPLAGIIALSTYIPLPQRLRAELAAANRTTPIFAAHGNDDDVVPERLGLAARDLLAELGCAVEWHSYPMPHSVCGDEIDALGRWLGERLGQATP
jgi:phospholipase/carboxylesterase